MTMIRPRLDVVYGIYRGLPSAHHALDVVYGICRGLPSDPLRSAENVTHRAEPTPSSRFSTYKPYMTISILGIDDFTKKSI